ncbi:MAG: vWA domain-containing protein [Brevinematia bacterium]
MRRGIVFLVFVGFFLGFASLSLADTYIIVIDTSLSMNRKVIDSLRVYDIALRSLSNSIFSLKVGEVVYVVDFNENVYVRPPIRVKDDHTKEVIYKIMTGTQPYGKWTFTYKMLKEVSQLIKESNLSPKDTKVIIISDGIDDPPVKSKEYFVELEKLSSLFDPQQLIYYISLEKLLQKEASKVPSGVSSISEKLRSTYQVKVIEVEDTNQVTGAVERGFRGEGLSGTLFILVIASVSGVVVLIVLWVFVRNVYLPLKARKSSKVSRITYLLGKTKKTIPLKSYKIVLSPSRGKVVLAGWTYSGEVIIKATTQGYRIFFTLPSGIAGNITNGSILKKGTTFVVANCTFEVE